MAEQSPQAPTEGKQVQATSSGRAAPPPPQTVEAARKAGKEAYERVTTRFRTLPESTARLQWPQMIAYGTKPGISPTAQYAVLTVLAEAADQSTLHVFPNLSVQEIMDHTSLSRSAVQRALAALEAGQIIERRRLSEHAPYTVTLTPHRAPLNLLALRSALRKEYQQAISNPAVLTVVLQQLERVVKRVREGGSKSEERGG